MAQCSNCNSELAEGARICQVCGSPVQTQPAQPQGWERQPTGEPQPWQPQGQPQGQSQAGGPPTGGPPPPPYPGPPPGQTGYQQQGQTYGQPGYGYGQPQQFPGGYGAPKTDGQAIAALVCGIIGIVACPIIFSIIAIVLGRQSERRVKESGGTLTGDQMAKAGWILGIIGLVLSVFWVLVFFGMFSSMMVGGF